MSHFREINAHIATKVAHSESYTNALWIYVSSKV